MAKLSIVAGATSQSVTLFIQDSSKTTGAGLTGLTASSPGLMAAYTFNGTNAGSVLIPLVTLGAVNSAYAGGDFKEVDSINMPGIYRFDIPNAALASGKGRSVVIYLQGATNMAPCVLEIELTGPDNQDGTRFGLTAMPNAAAGANGGLPTVNASNQVAVDGTSALTEAYPAKGGALTLATALYATLQNLEEFAISGTTISVRKRDQSTVAETFTLDSATTPTSRTRAT